MKKKVLLCFLEAFLLFTLAACGKDVQDGDVDQDERNGVVQESGSGQSQDEQDKDQDAPEEAAVVYNWDNSKTDAQPKSGTFTEDWDKDGTEDSLNIETEEQEGSEVIKRLELNMSGSGVPYVLENLDHYFIDILSGDFDADSEPEILLLFDMRYAGANGCLGLRLLDLTDTGYVDLTKDFFTGFEYSVEVKAGENGSYVISRTGGEPMEINVDNVPESAIGATTGFYFLDVLQGDDAAYYIRIKQYVAGEDMTDHVGDVVSIWEVRDGRLNCISEEITKPKG